jgi:hypothetical protein
LRIFSPEFYFADFFTLSQGFSFVKVKSNTYFQNELFSGLKLTNLGEILQSRQKGLLSAAPPWLVMIVEVGEGAAHLFQVAL